jgi:hypothetical protein
MLSLIAARVAGVGLAVFAGNDVRDEGLLKDLPKLATLPPAKVVREGRGVDGFHHHRRRGWTSPSNATASPRSSNAFGRVTSGPKAKPIASKFAPMATQQLR